MLHPRRLRKLDHNIRPNASEREHFCRFNAVRGEHGNQGLCEFDGDEALLKATLILICPVARRGDAHAFSSTAHA
jgi:hypothetical protein